MHRRIAAAVASLAALTSRDRLHQGQSNRGMKRPLRRALLFGIAATVKISLAIWLFRLGPMASN